MALGLFSKDGVCSMCTLCMYYLCLQSCHMLMLALVVLSQERLQFTDNIDVVTYRDNKRETHNPVGRAFAPVVWDYFQVRSSNIQKRLNFQIGKII